MVQQALKQVQTGGSKNAANTPWFHFFLFIFDGRFGTIIKRKNTSQTPTDFSAVHFGSRHFSFARIFFVVHNRHPILIDRRTTAPPCFENPACQKALFFQLQRHIFIPPAAKTLYHPAWRQEKFVHQKRVMNP